MARTTRPETAGWQIASNDALLGQVLADMGCRNTVFNAKAGDEDCGEPFADVCQKWVENVARAYRPYILACAPQRRSPQPWTWQRSQLQGWAPGTKPTCKVDSALPTIGRIDACDSIRAQRCLGLSSLSAFCLVL